MYIKIEQEKKMEAVTHEIPEYSPIFLYSTADRWTWKDRRRGPSGVSEAGDSALKTQVAKINRPTPERRETWGRFWCMKV